jgi:hypothetical protein
MAEPIFSATVERLYARLPEFIRTADLDQDYAAKRYLSLVGDRAGELEILIDRIDYVTTNDGGTIGDTSALVDPATADAAWLPWLAQLVGVRSGDLPTGALREAIGNAELGWQVGSQAAVIAAAQAHLTGTKTVTILRNYLGDQWRVRITTYTTETPRLTLEDLAQRFPTLDAIKAAYPTLNDIPNASTSIQAALELQRPAGVQFDFQVASGGTLDDLHADFATLDAVHVRFATLDAVAHHIPGS